MSYNLYIKIPVEDRNDIKKYYDIKEVILITDEKEINSNNFSINSDPANFVFEELAEQYIENCIEEELKPLFREKQGEIADYLYDNSDLMDTNWVVDVMNEYDI